MLAAAALGALGAQLEQLQAAKQDWFVGASLVDEQDISLEADGAVTVRRQAFDKALRNFPKTDSPSKAKAARKMEVTDYDQVIAGERFCSRSERQALASAAATTWWSSTSVSRVRRVTDGCCACRACLGFEYDCGCPLWRCNAMDQASSVRHRRPWRVLRLQQHERAIHRRLLQQGATQTVPAGETVGSVGAVGAAPVLSRDVVVAAVRI